MLYQVIIEPNAKDDLYSIFSYIKIDGSIQSAKNFIQELRKQIQTSSVHIVAIFRQGNY